MNHSKFRASLKLGEGLANWYFDTKGKMTVGIGRNLDDNPLTEGEAWFLSEAPIKAAIEGAPKLTTNWANLGDARQNVLAELCYNLGTQGAMGFKRMRAALDKGDYMMAALELLDSHWKVDVGPNRAQRLARQLQTGEWQ